MILLFFVLLIFILQKESLNLRKKKNKYIEKNFQTFLIKFFFMRY